MASTIPAAHKLPLIHSTRSNFVAVGFAPRARLILMAAIAERQQAATTTSRVSSSIGQ